MAPGGLGCRPRHFWGTILFEPPSQTSFEMYHARRHRTQRGRGASLRARARSGDDLAGARDKNLRNEAFSFFFCHASQRLSLHPRAMLGACHAPAAVGASQSMARWLSCTTKGQFNGVVDSGDDRRAVGTLTSRIASPTCIELPRRGPGPFAVYHLRTCHLPAGSYPPQLTGTADACSPR